MAKIILRDRVRTGRILNSLEDKGFVKRTNTTKNNRLVRLLTLTKAGEKFYNEQFYIMNKVMEKLLEKFPEEKMIELKGSLEKLENSMAEIVEFNI